MLIVFIYLVLVVGFTWIQKKKPQISVFRADHKVSWWISGLSLYMFYVSMDQGTLVAGIVAEHGMVGMWLLWATWLGAFVIPIVFAPLWQKMNFHTDNQFLLFRYSGKSAKFLHLFRAVYVGGLVVALSLCFHILGFARVIEVFFNVSFSTAVWISGCVLMVFSLKNAFELKLKMDVLHAFLYFTSMVIIVAALLYHLQDWGDVLNFFKKNPEKAQILPAYKNDSDWFSFLIFIGVQWWSCSLFDGGGPEMSRFTSLKSGRKAVLAGLLPVFLSFVFSFVLMWQIILLLGFSSPGLHPDLFYISNAFEVVPDVLKGFILIGFFSAFISTSESLLNWGGGLLTIDVVKEYIKPNIDHKTLKLYAFACMLLLALVGTLFAASIESLQVLIKITFSIAAGVAPVYILRWVWFRINAWSQFAAMISSGVLTLLYPLVHSSLPLSAYPLHESRILVVSLTTTVIWVSVTLLSTNHSTAVRAAMLPIIGSRKTFLYRLFFSFALGGLFLLIISSCWWVILSRFL